MLRGYQELVQAWHAPDKWCNCNSEDTCTLKGQNT